MVIFDGSNHLAIVLVSKSCFWLACGSSPSFRETNLSKPNLLGLTLQGISPGTLLYLSKASSPKMGLFVCIVTSRSHIFRLSATLHCFWLACKLTLFDIWNLIQDSIRSEKANRSSVISCSGWSYMDWESVWLITVKRYRDPEWAIYMDGWGGWGL